MTAPPTAPRHAPRALSALRVVGALAAAALALAACAAPSSAPPTPAPTATVDAPVPVVRAEPPAPVVPTPTPTPTATPTEAPPPAPVVVRADPGNNAGTADVPAEGRAWDTSHPDHVIGTGTPQSCTSDAVVAAVAAGGVVTFDCGPAPATIVLTQTAKVVNANGPVVIDGGGLVTLSGGGERRILYQNACDRAQGWTTSHCQDQDHPHLVVQNLTLADGNSTGETADGGGGGAIFVRGGKLTVISSTFLRNRCDPTGPDLGGAAIRATFVSGRGPVLVVDSTFGGAPGEGGVCSNGGAISSIGVSWEVLNTVMTHNEAVGEGANPARAGTPGGGSGGAIYTDGNTFTVRVAGSVIEGNRAREGGGAVFFVSNDRTGLLTYDRSRVEGNVSEGFENFRGTFYLGSTEDPVVVP